METPNLGISSYFIMKALKNNEISLMNYVLISLFLIHYINRTIIYPLRLGKSSKKMPIEIIMFGFGFTFANSYI